MAKGKYVIVRIVWLSIFLLPSFTIEAQIDLSIYNIQKNVDSVKESSIDELLENADIENFLPPLTELIDSAIKHSPEVRMAESQILRAEYSESEVRRDYWNTFSVGAQAAYGSSLQLQAGPSGTSSLIGFGDNFGQGQMLIGVSIPLDVWVNRSNRIGQMKAVVDQSKANRDLVVRTLKDEISALYYNLLMLKEQLLIVGEGAQIAVAIKESMEMDFSKGTIDFQTTATGMNYWQGSNFQYEALKTQFGLTYLTLERLIGIPFERFEGN